MIFVENRNGLANKLVQFLKCGKYFMTILKAVKIGPVNVLYRHKHVEMQHVLNYRAFFLYEKRFVMLS